MDVSVPIRCIKYVYPANSFTRQTILFTGNLSLVAGCTFYRGTNCFSRLWFRGFELGFSGLRKCFTHSVISPAPVSKQRSH